MPTDTPILILRLFDEPERREPREDRISSRRDGDHRTAAEAAQDRFGKRGGHRHRILAAIVSAGDHGATYEEAARAAGIGLQSAPWKRITELEQEYEMIADSGRTRPTSTDSPARVMVATQRGEEFVALNPVSGFESPTPHAMQDLLALLEYGVGRIYRKGDDLIAEVRGRLYRVTNARRLP